MGAAALAVFLAVLFHQAQCACRSRRVAQESNSAKSRFLANISHEIRTPLNGILATAELLERGSLPPAQAELVQAILSSSEDLISIVNDVLDFSRIETGRLPLECVPFSLQDLIVEVNRLFSEKAQAKGLRLQCSLGAGVPVAVEGDALRLRQVLCSLLSNAIKFTQAGEIRLELSVAGVPAEKTAILFRVCDTGIGIEPQTAGSLFHAFTQAESGATRRYGGMGLGLTIAHRLVTLMGGSIGVESEPAKGSTFWFVIPARAVPLVAAAEPAQPRPARREHILIVEDNPVNQLVALRAVTGMGYAAEVVSGGEAALDALARQQFHLVLMDCQMPGMDGYQASTEIRRREGITPGSRRIPIVAMTANAVAGDSERCREAGMDDYLAKPVRLEALASTLERWLEASPPHRGARIAPLTAPGPAVSPG